MVFSRRGADVLRAQDEKRVAGIAEREQRDHSQVFPIGRRKLPRADVDFRLGRDRRARLLDEDDQGERQQAGNHREIEDRADVEVKRVEQQQSDERTEKGAGVVADAFKPEGAAAMRFRDRSGNQRIARRRTGAGAQPVQEPRAEHDLPDRGEPHQRLADGGEKISGERDWFPPLQPVGQGAGQTLDDVLRRLGKAVDQADDAAGRPERLRQEHRQHRIEHLGRNVGEQAGESEEKRRP